MDIIAFTEGVQLVYASPLSRLVSPAHVVRTLCQDADYPKLASPMPANTPVNKVLHKRLCTALCTVLTWLRRAARGSAWLCLALLLPSNFRGGAGGGGSATQGKLPYSGGGVRGGGCSLKQAVTYNQGENQGECIVSSGIPSNEHDGAGGRNRFPHVRAAWGVIFLLFLLFRSGLLSFWVWHPCPPPLVCVERALACWWSVLWAWCAGVCSVVALMT